jgi:hypothetical protein
MANPTDVLLQLQTRINTLDRIKNVKVNQEDELEEDIGGSGSGGIGSGFGSSLSNRYDSDGTDVDDAEAVDEPYTTHRSISSANSDSDFDDDKIKVEMERMLREAPEDEVPPEEPPAEEAVEPPAEEAAPEGEMPPEGMEGAEGMPPEGMEGAEGMGGMEEEIQKPSQIGRIYELKKIYTRLTTIESYLSDSSDPELLRVRLLVSKSVELFEILSSNLKTYQPPTSPKETLDEIIIMYYKFIKQVYESVAKYFKNKKEKMIGSGLTKTKITISDKELV